MQIWRLLPVFMVVAMAAGSAGAADDAAPVACRLVRYASLDLRTEPDGRVSVPVAVNNNAVHLLVDTGGGFTALTHATALRFGLSINPMDSRGYFLGGAEEDSYVEVNSLDVGRMRGRDIKLTVMPDYMLNRDLAGLYAGNLLTPYDIELDFMNEKMSLFEPEQCSGNVVYWTRSPVARVPVVLDRLGHILVPVTLDGKELEAIVDTGAASSVMTVERAKDLLNINNADPKLARLPTGFFHYPFQSLMLSGVTVRNPDIQLVPSTAVIRQAPQILLGVSVLRQLHLYIAFHEKAMYLTSADAPPP